MTEAVLIDTGVANSASVRAALARLGVATRPAQSPDDTLRAGLVVLPGVGAFGAGMARLRAVGLDQALAARVREGRPTLAICLGMQLLCAASDESPGVAGLGVIPAALARFPAAVRTPQFGWNEVAPADGASLVHAGAAYFANSFRIAEAPAGWTVSWAHHGGPFVAAIERRAVLACQFHPELSGRWGAALLRRWLDSALLGAPAC